VIAVVHGAIVDPVLRQSVLLRVVFVIVGVVGAVAYGYREVFARYVIPIYDYTVAEVRRPTRTTLEVTLRPVEQQLTFVPGQFVFLALGGSDGWQRHPFSVSSSPSDPHLELTIKASGDYTRDLYDQLRPGIPAKLAGPFGGFDYRQGGPNQTDRSNGRSSSSTRSPALRTRSISTRSAPSRTDTRRSASIWSAPTPTEP